MDDLAADERVLDVRASKVLANVPQTADRLLLIVDQFEEIFTLCKDQEERRAYIDNLLIAAQTDGPTIVVLALRADFYRYCLDYENLRLLLEHHTKLIGPMSREQLREAIIAPAVTNGWDFEAGLVELFLDDVGDEPGALPLLGHALRETWERRRGHTLTLEGYSHVGRVQGAIGTTADRTFEGLNSEQKLVAKNIFLRLTELGEGSEDTRRRVRFVELLPVGEERQSVERVLKILADARLIITHEEDVEVAHEALIREWPQLRNWLDTNRANLQIHRQLSEATNLWLAHKRDSSYLYQGIKLEQIKTLRNSNPSLINSKEADFIGASEIALRRKQNLRIGAVFVGLLVTLMLILLQQWNNQRLAETNLDLQQSLNAKGTAEANSRVNLSKAETSEAQAVQYAYLAATREADAEHEGRRARANNLAAQALLRIEQVNPADDATILLAREAALTTFLPDFSFAKVEEMRLVVETAKPSGSGWHVKTRDVSIPPRFA